MVPIWFQFRGRRGAKCDLAHLVLQDAGRLLTAAEVASMLWVPKSSVYEQARSGQLPTVCLGRYRRFREESIREWVERHEAGAGQGR